MEGPRDSRRAGRLKFYLGTHETHWLARLDVPLFVSHVRLRKRKRLPQARVSWALDSGAFSELGKHGRWTIEEGAYVEAVDRYQRDIGLLDWAAPMDWMCEPFMVEKTGLSVEEHQHRTTANYLRLCESGLPFIPVLQGWTVADYARHVEIYADAGVELAHETIVGVGSVCRRQQTSEVSQIIRMLVEDCGISVHGFGVKTSGFERYGRLLTSADSMAWSYDARRTFPLPGCSHRSCANCPRYALRWRESALRVFDQMVMA